MKSDDDDLEAEALFDLDQTLADADQDHSDLDQTSADVDQTASERDQLSADRDQAAADHDQATSDRAHTDGADGDADDYARTRRARSQSATERDLTTQVRLQTAHVRDEAAAQRDRLAEDRDRAALARDRLAATLDAEIDRLERDSKRDDGGKVTGLEVLMHAAQHRRRAAKTRAQAAAQREAAARDRETAAKDRHLAALDRAAAAEELALEGVDYLTGALRRRAGQLAMQREMDRTRRSGERVVVAFIDVDGLKAVNDARGHAAGDEILRQVADRIRSQLRSSDVIVRFGGDEFVCSMSGQDAAGARERFDRIAVQFADEADLSFTVGIAERAEEDTLGELVDRADAAMLDARQRRKR